MIETILVPTDGSGHAEKAVAVAVDMASRYGARLVIVHVLLRHTAASDLISLLEGAAAPEPLMNKLSELEEAMFDTAAASYGPVAVPVPREVLQQVGELIAEKARRAAEEAGVKDVTVEVVDGAPADRIIAAAGHESADVIVMGSRGLGKFAELMMGSVSHKVSHLARCSCFIVK